MGLDQRKENILDFIVRDYIETATPVSSGRVSKGSSKRELAVSPATIRNIMLELDCDDYLYQPHTSAGRAPTEKGYRYFVDNLMEIENPSEAIRSDLDKILNEFASESESVFDEFGKALARHLNLFSGFGFLDGVSPRIFGHGLPEVLREPEFFEHSMAIRFADFAENINQNIKKYSDTDTDAKGFGVVKIIFKDSDFGECVVFSAGPQRMDYEKAKSVLEYAAGDIKKRKNRKKYG